MIDLTSDVLPIPTSRQTTEADAAADVSCMRPDTTSTAMASNVVKINPRIIRQWINRLPFFTRIILVIDVVLYFASIFAPFVSNTLSLEPSKVHLFSGMLSLWNRRVCTSEMLIYSTSSTSLNNIPLCARALFPGALEHPSASVPAGPL